MWNTYTNNTIYKAKQNLKEGIRTEVVYLNIPLKEKKVSNRLNYIIPTIIMLIMIVYMLCKEYKKTPR